MQAQILPETSRRRVEEKIRTLLLEHRPDVAYTLRVHIVFHRNRRTMISWSRKDGAGILRLHQIFARAPASVLDAVVRHFFTSLEAREKSALRALIMDFVDANRHATICESHFPRVRPPRGRFYDLDDIHKRVIELHVPEYRSRNGLLRMGWSYRRTPSLMGKWIEGPPGRPNLIVVNRLLDTKEVPSFYVEYIVYHELLHDLFPIERRAGRWVHHSAEFRRRERDFPRYRDARRWEEQELPELLCRHELCPPS